MGVDDACGSGVLGVVETRSLLALLAACSHCRWTRVQYDPHWGMSRPACALLHELLQILPTLEDVLSRLCIAGRAAAAYLYRVGYELDLVPHVHCCTLLALLAACSHCRWTTVEYDPHWRMSRPACALLDELLQRTCTKLSMS